MRLVILLALACGFAQAMEWTNPISQSDGDSLGPAPTAQQGTPTPGGKRGTIMQSDGDYIGPIQPAVKTGKVPKAKPEAAPAPSVAKEPIATTPVQAAPAPAPAPVAVAKKSEPDPTDEQVRRLEEKIARLEASLGSGRGAYKSGSTLRIDGGSHESILERMHRFEDELAAAKRDVAARDDEIASLRNRLNAALGRCETLTEKLDALSHAHESLETAQQELADRQHKITELGEQLATSELVRLKIERLYYLLASQVIRLSPSHTQDIVELQDQVREQAKELESQNPISEGEQ